MGRWGWARYGDNVEPSSRSESSSLLERVVEWSRSGWRSRSAAGGLSRRRSDLNLVIVASAKREIVAAPGKMLALGLT